MRYLQFPHQGSAEADPGIPFSNVRNWLHKYGLIVGVLCVGGAGAYLGPERYIAGQAARKQHDQLSKAIANLPASQHANFNLLRSQLAGRGLLPVHANTITREDVETCGKIPIRDRHQPVILDSGERTLNVVVCDRSGNAVGDFEFGFGDQKR